MIILLVKRDDAKKHTYKPGQTIETYRLRNGSKINLPIYYRNQLFTEEEKEALFLDKIEKGIIYVMGQKVHRDDENYYLQLLDEGRKTECRLYGYNLQKWEQQKVYNMLNRIAVSGGTYRDWLETVFTGGNYMERCETPMFEGGMSTENGL